ncbi:tetratricopeptide repeat protein [Limnoraphis robusta Tam1]|uniref:Tetratricopeptide repeat protein n=1 Tax=Limnoraphis robusta CCNP1315 TaxID=3110306 RepID=A0ABU5TRK3_9CYAN|nr:tetratricopeptide repeat protein [Limnoraphis robusta]MEA5497567.1 tetratricopeptide repeat protein [Limnoraphis robusta BA-68 BA1]MEA5517350.1 tetratricopeptide repeat protein [Limnoraphis robusta CCNP1315]MEA5542970.1 tetratricopeptide repeat protein [Limnoraphis robusta Tam1]MEA5546061.1 tetratricopeptide repeat protein [Limnoraphis robusta CCNP1324]
MLNLKALTLAAIVGVLSPILPPNVLSESPVLAQTQQQRKAEADRLLDLGIQQFNISQFREALQSFQQALDIYREIGNRQGEANSLNNLGNAYNSLGQYQKAIEFHQQSLTIAREIGVSEAPTKEARNGEARSLGNLGSVYFRLEQYHQKGIEFHQQSLAIKREIGVSEVPTKEAHSGEGSSLGGLGNAYHSLGQYQKAIEFHQQSLTIAREIGDRRGEGSSLGGLGNAYHSLGQYHQAIEFYQQSLTIFREIGVSESPTKEVRFGEAVSLMNLGIAYRNLGQYQKAIEFHQQWLTIAREIGDRSGEANSLNSLGWTYWNLAQYQKAIELYQQSLSIAREIGYHQAEANSLGNLGLAYQTLGQYQQAVEFYQQALAIDKKTGDRRGKAASLNNLGLAYESLGQYQKAIEFYQQSLTIAREIGDRRGEGSSLGGLGSAYNSLGQYHQAIEFYQQWLTIAREIGDRRGEGSSLGGLGNAYLFLGQYQQAIEFYQQWLTIAREIGDRSGEGLSLSNIGILLEKQNQPEVAIVFLKQSVNTTELIRQDLQSLSRELQQSYTDTVAGRYRRLADLLLSQGRIAEAQQVLELLKVEELREFTRNTNIRESTERISLNNFEQKIIDEYGTLIEFGAKVYDCERNRCQQLPQLKEQRRLLSEQFNQKIDEQIAVIRENRQTDDSFYDPRYLNETARDIVEAQPGTVLIYPLVLEDKLWILWTTAGNVAGSKEIPVSQQQLGNMVVKFRALLDNPNSNLQELQATAQQLYQWLIQPIESELTQNKIERLVFAQDRVTRYIPMAALHDGEQYLIQRYTIHSILSAQLTDMNDKLSPGIEENSVLALGLSNGVAEFDPLPNVETELNNIVRSDERDSEGIYLGQKYLNQAFTFDILTQNVAGHRILHIATHGKFEPGVPENSFIVLGTGERLTIPEINSIGSELKDVHLVVLSACETALGGPDAEGIEIAGISSYFLQAQRASAVMASLWLVNDPATSRLMQQFYSYLSSGKTKAEALQLAQLSFLDNNPNLAENRSRTGDATIVLVDDETGLPVDVSNNLSHPYYWAAFILIGNGL